ncbi:hypothetical protein [Romboutsia lituseburensis]|uniref:hypothetical protein n=1 Tax=Romboutsia lituseburensis TaxID=1537 RepID=UPI00215A0F21|nr:hypothetical protein [Romboutsia lituseburensis]MCR8746209.1 hypothetical protein [Romboutsia lituseburensis]
MLERLTNQELIQIMNKKELSDGLIRYNYIQDNLHKVNVMEDIIFQDIFIRFYQVQVHKFRGIKECIFRILEENKNNKDIKFEYVLRELYRATGTIQPSYASKIVATINTDKAVIDSWVYKNLGLVRKYGTDNITYTIDQYYQVNNMLNEILKIDRSKYIVDIFDAYFNHNNLTDIKKLDLIIWQWR